MYLPLYMIARYLSLLPSNTFRILQGAIEADRIEDFEDIINLLSASDPRLAPYLTKDALMSRALSSKGGWNILLNMLDVLRHQLADETDVDSLISLAIQSPDIEHFILVETLLKINHPRLARRLLKLKSWNPHNISSGRLKEIIDYAPQNLGYYLKYFDSTRLLDNPPTVTVWDAVEPRDEDLKVSQARQLFYRTVIPFYSQFEIIKVIASLPEVLVPEHLNVLLGIRSNPRVSQHLEQLDSNFLGYSRSLAEFEIYNSVFPHSISTWLELNILKYAADDLIRYIVCSKRFAPRGEAEAFKLATQKVGRSPGLRSPKKTFTELETSKIINQLSKL
jgi:hypothetical protein